MSNKDEKHEPDPSTPPRPPRFAGDAGGSNSAQDNMRQDVQDSEDSQDAVREKCQEYLDGWKRAKADYDNLKKDVEKAKMEIVSYANENLLYDLLPAIEQFETALEHTPDLSGLPDEEKKKLTNWFTGIKAVKQMWEQTFKSIGLEHVETENGFDPSKHDAVDSETDAEKDDGAIIRVIQPGWKLKNKILRPAKVIVNSKTSK